MNSTILKPNSRPNTIKLWNLIKKSDLKICIQDIAKLLFIILNEFLVNTSLVAERLEVPTEGLSPEGLSVRIFESMMATLLTCNLSTEDCIKLFKELGIDKETIQEY